VLPAVIARCDSPSACPCSQRNSTKLYKTPLLHTTLLNKFLFLLPSSRVFQSATTSTCRLSLTLAKPRLRFICSFINEPPVRFHAVISSHSAVMAQSRPIRKRVRMLASSTCASPRISSIKRYCFGLKRPRLARRRVAFLQKAPNQVRVVLKVRGNFPVVCRSITLTPAIVSRLYFLTTTGFVAAPFMWPRVPSHKSAAKFPNNLSS